MKKKITGSHVAEDDGKVTFTWDNSFSYFSSKTLLYKIKKTAVVQDLDDQQEEEIEDEEEVKDEQKDQSSGK